MRSIKNNYICVYYIQNSCLQLCGKTLMMLDAAALAELGITSSLDRVRILGYIGTQPRSIPLDQQQHQRHSVKGPMSMRVWYHGSVSTAEASARVESAASGAFLVRNSDSLPGQLVLCVNRVGHALMLRIVLDLDGHFLLGGRSYKSMDTLIEYYTVHPIPNERGERLFLTAPVHAPHLGLSCLTSAENASLA